jgi:N-acyl-D-amino-acid deacylase
LDGQSSHLYDIFIRNGTVYDGIATPPRVVDVAIRGDRVAALGPALPGRAGETVDASGKAVAPGFINMLSHSYHSLLVDGRGLSELTQGVTTQVFGEGHSMGPLTAEMRNRMRENQPFGRFDVPWSSLAGYLAHAEATGVAQNVCSYIGATSLRAYVVGEDDRPATAAELETMRAIVRDEMAAGALGIGSSLIYPPAFFASTEELIALCDAAAPYEGKYISHMRNEGNALLEAIDELVRISREGGVAAEIYHLKAGGVDNWPKMDQAIERVESARAEGLAITADMYTYRAGATGLSNAIPPWFHDGGAPRLYERLADPGQRAAIRTAIETQFDGWENFLHGTGGPHGVLILQVRKPEHRKYQGKRLSEIAGMMGVDAIEALMDLVRDDRSRVTTAYFMMSEENVRRQVQLPWMAFGSDAQAVAREGAFLEASTHPRAYGNFARLLGHYVRDEGLVPMEEAIRRLTSFPAENLGLKQRGRLEEGCYADVVVFDPATITDRATFEAPHAYSEGVEQVIVNGSFALRDGQATGTMPGRALHGAGLR